MQTDQLVKIAALIFRGQALVAQGDFDTAQSVFDAARAALFQEKYFSEFVTIDGVGQHPEGNYAEWLRARTRSWGELYVYCPQCADGEVIDEETGEALICDLCEGTGQIELHPVTGRPIDERVGDIIKDLKIGKIG
jgi:hypothetical protein